MPHWIASLICVGLVASVGQSPQVDREISQQFDAQRADTERRVEITDLKGRVDALFSLMVEREKQVALALTSSESARIKSEQAQANVNATQNEWRGSLEDLGQLMATKEDVERLVARVSTLETHSAAVSGRSGGFGSASTMVFQVLPLLVSLVALGWAIRQRPKPVRDT